VARYSIRKTESLPSNKYSLLVTETDKKEFNYRRYVLLGWVCTGRERGTWTGFQKHSLSSGDNCLTCSEGGGNK
jgi:hypothetical protein